MLRALRSLSLDAFASGMLVLAPLAFAYDSSSVADVNRLGGKPRWAALRTFLSIARDAGGARP